VIAPTCSCGIGDAYNKDLEFLDQITNQVCANYDILKGLALRLLNIKSANFNQTASLGWLGSWTVKIGEYC